MMARVAVLAGAAALLSACGDDLESRNAAVQTERPQEGMRVVQSNTKSRSTAQSSAPAAPASFADAEADDGEEVLEVEAGPESFIDDAQGFSTDPIDNTAGFDPTPADPQGFAAEPGFDD
ncbi:hypothetical protein OZN62_11955 [Aurantiacibacter sp. MUD11]|uniref:hypothetical protein n=1 Tax=Aurantiacibacter sp. MUD11 TaxID=3003265 RepID=UPI0022AB321C|nr:hypothetical protein [Aurantiacibacter sp. MUD11]WAT17619.1 hypothetical protein OZN62_11955 [Aurantiacibacter sp. MUD11]